MNEDVKNKVNNLASRPYEEIKFIIDNPYAWEFKKDGVDHQAEIVAVWEDKDRGLIRLIGYDISNKSKWWSHFFSKSSYEKIVKP